MLRWLLGLTTEDSISRMNQECLIPLSSLFPEGRLGPRGMSWWDYCIYLQLPFLLPISSSLETSLWVSYIQKRIENICLTTLRSRSEQCLWWIVLMTSSRNSMVTFLLNPVPMAQASVVVPNINGSQLQCCLHTALDWRHSFCVCYWSWHKTHTHAHVHTHTHTLTHYQEKLSLRVIRRQI